MVKKKANRTWYIIATLLLLVAVVLAVSAFVLTRGSGAPSLPEGSVTIKGEVICLPHKNTDGPQTMECAMGIKDEKGGNYALSDTDPNYKNISALPTGKTVEVTGIVKPAGDSKYQTKGTIEITKTKIVE